MQLLHLLLELLIVELQFLHLAGEVADGFLQPVKTLKGFQRVRVPAGGSVTVTFTVGPEERRYWSAAPRDWVVDASTFDVWAGGDSTASLHGEFTVTPA